MSANYFKLDNKVAVVTGGCGLLGSEYCRCLAEAGAHVIIADLEHQKCKALELEIREKGYGATGLQVDLADEFSVKDWAKRIKDNFQGVDIIVNNAAVKTKNFFAPLEEYSLEDWNGTLAVNITGMFLVVRELGPLMTARKAGASLMSAHLRGGSSGQRIYGFCFINTGKQFIPQRLFSDQGRSGCLY